ncbi:hypothetical protein [Streptomyces ureilyticus]|uniref:Uncharacterized protein n=1 Tax=Streptomyces ureilyticus TaxID=1775131 RepID=A0ABX0DGB7_9ACTN|nr:hypothetical protein [Streptomyces ureilyticus]NGO40911.1 hypothetical protein [Streptomyces ureilyticus]
MTGRYPIVRHRELRPRWRWSAWRERRHPLIAGRGEVLVHDVGRAYTTGTAAPTRRTAVPWSMSAPAGEYPPTGS